MFRVLAGYRTRIRRRNYSRSQITVRLREATVPKITVTLRKAYGGAHIVMSCKQLRGDINYAWPSAEIAVMGAEGAIEVLYSKEIAAEKDPEKEGSHYGREKERIQQVVPNPYNAARYGYIDDIIEPRNTRFASFVLYSNYKPKNW